MFFDNFNQPIKYGLPLISARNIKLALNERNAGRMTSLESTLQLTDSFRVANPHPYLEPLKSLCRFLPLDARLLNLGSPLLLGRYSTPQLRSQLKEVLSKVSAKALRARLRAVLDVDYTAKLSKISVSTIYLRAIDDRIVPTAASKHILKSASEVTVVSVAGPHLLLQAKPVVAAKAVKQFLHNVVGSDDAVD